MRFDYFYFIGWMDSKIEGKTNAEIIKRKLNGNSQERRSM